jgi:hypothetical protein
MKLSDSSVEVCLRENLTHPLLGVLSYGPNFINLDISLILIIAGFSIFCQLAKNLFRNIK